MKKAITIIWLLFMFGSGMCQFLIKNSSDTELMRVNQEGAVGINNSNPKARLSVIGDAGMINQIGDWTGEIGFDPSRFGIHARLENSVRDVSTQDAIRGTTFRPEGSAQGASDNFFTGVRGMTVTDNNSERVLISQGVLGFSKREGSLQSEMGVAGIIVNANNINGLANEFHAVNAQVLGNENNYDNMYALYAWGAKSYFQKQIGLGSATHPGSGKWIDVDSRAYCDGNTWVNASSRDFKSDIIPLDIQDASAALEGLSPVTYKYNNDLSDVHVGFIAEEVPDLVAEPGRRGLNAMDITAVLTRVVQEQQQAIKSMSARISELEQQLAR